MGNSSEEVAPVKSEQPAPQPVAPTQNYAAFQPQQRGLLAEQMQAGYGGLLSGYQGQGGYQDMQVPLIQRPSDIEQYLAYLENQKRGGMVGTPAASASAPAQTPMGQESMTMGAWDKNGDSGGAY